MDMQKIFDKVPRERIYNTFRRMSINGMVIETTQSLYARTRNVIVISPKFYWHSNGRGVTKQFKLLLSIVYMNKILKEANVKTRSICIGHRSEIGGVVLHIFWWHSVVLACTVGELQNKIKQYSKEIWNENVYRDDEGNRGDETGSKVENRNRPGEGTTNEWGQIIL